MSKVIEIDDPKITLHENAPKCEMLALERGTFIYNFLYIQSSKPLKFSRGLRPRTSYDFRKRIYFLMISFYVGHASFSSYLRRRISTLHLHFLLLNLHACKFYFGLNSD